MTSMASADPLRAARAPTQACYNCRKRRLRCDRSFPTCHKCTALGQECLGYGKVYKWADGMATGRGRKKVAKQQSTAATASSVQAASSHLGSGRYAQSSQSHTSDSPATCSSCTDTTTNSGGEDGCMSPSHTDTHTQQLQLVRGATRHPAPWVLIDPVFQDMAYPYRYYLSYFTTRLCRDLVSYDLPNHNPFRSLIPLTKAHPLLQHIIVAASAAHMSNLTRPPLAPQSCSTSRKLICTDSAESSQRALIDALVAKQKALRLLNEALENIDSIESDVVLASVLFFINFELIESGKHGWKAHLEGAGRIMTFLRPPDDEANDSLRDYILSDCFIYYILASAFMPTAPAQSSYFQSARISSILERAASNSYLCCPPQVLEILLAAAQLSNTKTDDDASLEKVGKAAADLIARAAAFDIQSWANQVRSLHDPEHAHVPIQSRIHAGSAHLLASTLYIWQAVPSVAAYLAPDTEEALEQQIFHHLESIPEEDPNFKSTTWPTFIAGAGARDHERQAWVLHRLHRLVANCPWGFIYTAIETLQVIWGLKGEGKVPRSWVQTLKDPDMNFLIV